MFLTQFFGALNDNVYKQALLLVITYGWIQQQTASISLLYFLCDRWAAGR